MVPLLLVPDKLDIIFVIVPFRDPKPGVSRCGRIWTIKARVILSTVLLCIKINIL